VSEVPYASRSQMSYLAAVRRSVTVFCSDVKLPGILTALLASALITFSGEQAASTEKWTAPAAEARLGATLSNFGIVNPLQDPTLDLHDSTGNTIATNDDWQTATNANQIPVAFQPADSHEPAILATFLPGSRFRRLVWLRRMGTRRRFLRLCRPAISAIVSGKNGETGVALVDVFHSF